MHVTVKNIIGSQFGSILISGRLYTLDHENGISISTVITQR